jgi:hypothetical protein
MFWRVEPIWGDDFRQGVSQPGEAMGLILQFSFRGASAKHAGVCHRGGAGFSDGDQITAGSLVLDGCGSESLFDQHECGPANFVDE